MIIGQEWRSYRKTLLIWGSCIAGLNLLMLLLYPGLQETMQGLAVTYESMGDFGTAFGMDKLNLGQPIGFYGSYVGAILSLGGAMFAAILGTSVLAKEEGGHTAEYLFTLPYSRSEIVIKKIAAILLLLIVFDLVNVVCGVIGLQAIDAKYSLKELLLYHAGQWMMHIEVAAVCILISACTKKVTVGAGLGIALLLYFADMMARILEPLSFCKYLTPYYYSNAADVLVKGSIDKWLLLIGIIVTIACLFSSVAWYEKKDLSA